MTILLLFLLVAALGFAFTVRAIDRDGYGMGGRLPRSHDTEFGAAVLR